MITLHPATRLACWMLLVLAIRLARSGDAGLRRYALGFAGLAAWQLASGLSNVVLGWPIVAALAHAAGAAALVAVGTSLWCRARPQPSVAATAQSASKRLWL